VASKLAANRWKDRDFAAALLRERLIDADVLIERIEALDRASAAMIERLVAWVHSQGG
jgi:hypothetical protein